QSYSQDTESSCIYLTADGTSICENDSHLLTIDEDALSRMQELFPVSPVVLPTEPLQPALINNSSTPATEDLVRSCVTPRKVQRVRETRQPGTDLYKLICCLKIAYIDFLFSFSLVLIFTTFPVGPEHMQNKCQVSVEEI
ncbi:unnamed protein product, partial [Porites evermanni]